jgi:hypothetical protein
MPGCTFEKTPKSVFKLISTQARLLSQMAGRR